MISGAQIVGHPNGKRLPRRFGGAGAGSHPDGDVVKILQIIDEH